MYVCVCVCERERERERERENEGGMHTSTSYVVTGSSIAKRH